MGKLLILGLIFTASLLGQVHPISATDRSAERSLMVEGKAYVVHYKYSASFGLISYPATSPLGRRHYQALVTVYEKRGKNLLFLHEARGVYVEGEHCFEDDPDMIVKAVLEQLKKIQQPKPRPKSKGEGK